MTGIHRPKSYKEGKMEHNTCRRCKEYNTKYPSSAIQCAFKNKTKTFNKDNWNCATMNALRKIAEEGCYWNEDQHLGVVPLKGEGGFLVLSWYKDKGRTSGAWIIEESRIKRLTLKKADRIIELYTLNKQK